jgi:hypothetical protein
MMRKMSLRIATIICFLILLLVVRTGDILAGLPTTTQQCIIICPSSLQAQADVLSSFHNTDEGISSTVVTIESINSNYSAVGDPPFDCSLLAITFQVVLVNMLL